MQAAKNNNVSGDRWPIIRIAATATLLSWGLLVDARAADPPLAVKSGPDAANVEVFHGARILSGTFDSPTGDRKGKEGWVQVEMMVGVDGRPYETTVVDSSNAVFDAAAVKAANRIFFRPAKRGSMPVDSSFTVKLIFFSDVEAAHGAHHKFATAYKALSKAIDSADKSQADAALANLEVQNLYEDAFWAYGRYLYDHKWGTEVEQRADLRRAVANEKAGRYLPDGMFHAALEAEFALDVSLKDYGSALETWAVLEPIAPESVHSELQRTVDAIKSMQGSDQVVRMTQQIDKGTSWNGRLFKSGFDISVVSGAVSEIKLRCKQQYLLFKYVPGVRYTIDNWNTGECDIEVVGQSGTVFELAQ